MLGRVILSLVACLSFLIGLPEQVWANQGNSEGKQASVPDQVPEKENLNKGKKNEESPTGEKPQNSSSEVVSEKGMKEDSPQTTRASDRSKEVKAKDHRKTETNKNADRSMKKGNSQAGKNREFKNNDTKGKSSGPPISSPQKHKKPKTHVHNKKVKEKMKQEEHKSSVVDSSELGKVSVKGTSSKENEKALDNRKTDEKRNRSVKNILLDLPPPVEDPTGKKPIRNEGVLQHSSLSLHGKTGKDRSQGDSAYQWFLGDLYIYVSESAENHTEMVLRHHRLRTQWMNAPPGEPPKRASLFL
ncbi:hypothetical protein LC065_00005 [Halobacillus litoralis]|uniref:hypothetical protein n=1 Tax=Halobacillus litoralis TaxID=45668 RepID=UPI001CFF3702|nr:hypothetical protein [Halobacillus litoralis]WLR47740.1 hypothetical protein LC065_00005 [Halobacillus litoralis]